MKVNIKKMILLLVLLVVVGVGSIVGYISYTKSNSTVKTELFPIEQSFIVNIQSDNGKNKILKTSITLEYKGKKGSEKLTTEMSKVNDVLISTLSSKSEDELRPTKRKELKNDLVSELNTILGKKMIVDVYFNDFLIN